MRSGAAGVVFLACCTAKGEPRPPAAATPSGTIAYTRGPELRVIEPDGNGDHVVWRAPAIAGQAGLTYTVTSPAWRPDGGELAFASDHEAAISPYATDVYIVRADGSNLRKLTNAPAHAQLASYPKGTVTVSVQLGAVGPFFVYVQGAPEPKVISAGGRLVFRDVADLGAAGQAVTATNGADRWSGTPVDVVAGKTVDAGLLSLSAFGGAPGYGAGAPFWRSDGGHVGYLGPLCLAAQLPASPPLGFRFEPLLAAKAPDLCAIDAGPTAATADQLLLATVGFDTDGHSFVYLARDGARELPPPLLTFDRYRRISDLHWLPSGKGFVVARQDDLTDEDMNLHEFDLASRTLRQLTSFAFPDGTKLRRFTLSPDGGTIVFERAADLRSAPSDLWIVKRDGSGLRRLVAGGGFPAWSPARR